MQPLPAAAPLTRAEASKAYRVNRNDRGRENARSVRNAFMNITGASHGVLMHSVQIIGTEDHDGTTYFRIRCRCVDSASKEWDVIRRYNEFNDLRDNLGVLDKRVGSIFPQKTGWFKAKDGEVGKRAQLLQVWLNGLIAEFASGGDGRNSLLPINRTEKLARMHRFFGIDLDGNLFPDSAPVQQDTSAVASNASAIPAVSAAAAIPHGPSAQQALSGSMPSAPPALSSEDVQVKVQAEEDAQLEADLAAIRQLEEREDLEKQEAEAKKRAEEEEILRLKAQEEEALRAKAEEDAARLKAEQDEIARQVAEQAEKEQQAREAQEAEEARQKAEAEEAARLKAAAEEEAARLKAEEDARTEAEEQARKKAEAEKSWLQRAVDMEKNAREIEAEGRREEALQQFRNTIAVFKFVIKREKSTKIQGMVQARCDELSQHADKLWETLAAEQLGVSLERPSAVDAGIPSAPIPTAVAAPSAVVGPSTVPA